MGNYIAHPSSSNNATGKVILADGTVHEFDSPLTAAELMLEHPQQVVVEFHPGLTDQKRPIPLPADQKLEMKKVYLMLPMKRGKPASLSSEEARHVLLSANSILRSKSILVSPKFLPLFYRICTAGIGEGQKLLVTDQSENGEERLVAEKCNSLELLAAESLEGCCRPDYLSRQMSGRGWKPSLDTIKEKRAEKKVSHWLF